MDAPPTGKDERLRAPRSKGPWPCIGDPVPLMTASGGSAANAQVTLQGRARRAWGGRRAALRMER